MQFPVSFQSAKETAKEDQKSTRLDVESGEYAADTWLVSRGNSLVIASHSFARREAERSRVERGRREEARGDGRHLKSTVEKIMATDLKTTLCYFVERVSGQLIREGGGKKCSFERDSFRRSTTKRTILCANMEIHIVEFASSTREESRLDAIAMSRLITREDILHGL